MAEIMATDILVIGTGASGLIFALEMAETHRVTVITKADPEETNTSYAQGGIAAVLDPADNFEKHLSDTIKVGELLNDMYVAATIVQSAPKAIEYLANIGVTFAKNDSTFALGREGGHSYKRIVNVHDTTGKEIQKALLKKVRQHENITILAHHTAIDLIIHDNVCYGVWCLNSKNELVTITSRLTMLATGGMGYLYAYTSNPSIATGDGYAMGYRAGAKLSDIEFVQFHPTALYIKNQKPFLLSESLRGEGACIVNENDEPIMGKYHPDKDLAPRDIVSRAVYNESKNGQIYLDMRHFEKAYIKKQFPAIHETLLQYSIDCTKEKIPIYPVAHYMCGGVKVDINCKTTVDQLLASGETCASGLHGANRLASNSLLEAVSLSRSSAEYFRDSPLPTSKVPKVHAPVFKEIIHTKKDTDAVRKLMWEKVGIIRNAKLLDEAKNDLSGIDIQHLACNTNYLEYRNMVQLARLIAYAASLRLESRGTHFREDYPKKDTSWQQHIEIQKLPKS